MTHFTVDKISGISVLALAGAIVAGAASLTSANAQSAAPVAVPQGDAKQEAKPVREKISAVEKPGVDADAAARKCIDKLSSPDFSERDGAIEKLHALGKGAIPALKEAAESNPQMEVRWNARRILRELDGTKPKKRAAAEGMKAKVRTGAGGDFFLEVPTLEDLMLDAKDLDVSKRDALEQNLRQQMEKLEHRMKELQERLHSELRAKTGVDTMGIEPGHGAFAGSSVQIVHDDDHVRVVVKEKNADGAEDVKSYEAASMQEFKEKYPDVARKYFGGGNRTGVIRLRSTGPAGKFEIGESAAIDMDEDEAFDMDVDDATGRMRVVPGTPFGAAPDMAKVIGPDNGERLGVHVKPVDPGLAQFLGIPRGTGFQVENVEAGTMAEAMGVKANDVVVCIDGKAIGRDTTVREALAGVPAGRTLRVDVIRGGEGKKSLEVEKRGAATPKRAQR
jgi:hypothetical protein